MATKITTYDWAAGSALYHSVKGLIFLRGYPESLAFKVSYLFKDNDRNLPIKNEARLRDILFDRIKKSYNFRIIKYDLKYPKLSDDFLSKFKVEKFKLIKSQNRDETFESSGNFEVYPRTFVCGKCGHYRYFRRDEKLGTECEKDGCHGKYVQMSALKFCETCGKVEEFYYRCENRDNHSSKESLTFKWPVKDEPITWKFVCDVCSTERDPFNMWCNHKLPDGTVIAEKDSTKVKIMTLREGNVFQPVVITAVDLPDTSNIAMQDLEYVLLAISLGKFDDIQEQLKQISSDILKSINALNHSYRDPVNKKMTIEDERRKYPAITEEKFEQLWKNRFKIDQIERTIEDVKRSFNIETMDIESFNNFNALKGMFSDKKDITEYEEFVGNSREAKEIKLADYNYIKERFKLKNISHISKLRLVSSCIGTINGVNRFYETGFVPHFEPIWTNKKDELLAFSYPYETEGLLFEFDKNYVVEWLKKNGFSIPHTSSGEFLLKMEKKSDEYNVVYTLLHTLSHLLLKKSSLHTGLAEQSCGEMIFPNNCAILLFSTSNVNIGGFHFIFENYLYDLFIGADFELKKCIYDPLCIKEKGACFSCMYLPEHVCNNMNQSLDRGVLIGNVRNYKYKFW